MMRALQGLLSMGLLAGGLILPGLALAADPASVLAALRQGAYVTQSNPPLPNTARSIAAETPHGDLSLSAGPTSGHAAPALTLSSAHHSLSLESQARLIPTSAGGRAVAGAQLQLGGRDPAQDPGRRIADHFGLADDHSIDSASHGRWFLFAEGSGDLVGLRLNRLGRGLSPSSAMTFDGDIQPTEVADSQAGLGWRRGAMQASFGYVHREIRNAAANDANHPVNDIKGDMVALTFSLRGR